MNCKDENLLSRNLSLLRVTCLPDPSLFRQAHYERESPYSFKDELSMSMLERKLDANIITTQLDTIISWARKSALVADDLRVGLLCD